MTGVVNRFYPDDRRRLHDAGRSAATGGQLLC